VVGDVTDWDGVSDALGKGAPSMRAAKRLVFDLRANPDDETGIEFVFGWSGVNSILASEPVATPGYRFRMHSGFAPQTGSTSGGYWSGLYTRQGDVIRPSTPGASATTRRMAFIVNSRSGIPSIARTLQAQGAAVIVAAGELDPAITVGGIGDSEAAGAVYRVDLVEGIKADVRIADLVDATGPFVTIPDTVVTAGSAQAPVAAALELVRRPARRRVSERPTSASTLASPERPYAEKAYPAMEHRLLAAYRFWNAIHYFFPYKHLMGENWDAVLVEAIPRFEAARDSLEYALAVVELVTRIHDSHGFVRSAALGSYLGNAGPGIVPRMIEGQPVIVQIAPDSATRASGIAVGDVIVRVDGEDVRARMRTLSRYVASSTPQALEHTLVRSVLGGLDGSTAVIVVRGANGREREVRLPRRRAYRQEMGPARTGPIFRVLAGNIGYVDLERLSVPMVDSMFDVLRDTKAIIFDMRGYPQGTAWPIAPRLTNRTNVTGARFQRPLVMSPDSTQWSAYAFDQLLPRTTKARYLRPTVMLIDERTVSQAEHTGLFFEAANGTKFVGSPTMGANGDVTAVVLPGGLVASFSGHDVRHADGRQLQRLGLQPHVLVRPTIAGIRAGRDEVLMRAIQFVNAGR
jgi:C-terminal processing protease CtpA/Prc